MSESSDSSIRALFKGGSVVFIGSLVGMVISFVSVIVIGRLLGPTGYGAIGLGSTLLTAVSTLVLLGMNTGIGRYLPRYDDPQRRRGVLVSGFQMVLPLSVLSAAIMIFFADEIATHAFNDPAVAPVIQVFALALPLASIEKLSVGGIQGVKRTLPKVYVEDLTAHSVRLILAVAILLAGYGVVGVSFAYMLGHGAAAALGLYYMWKYTSLFERVPAITMRKELLAFSTPLVISAVMVKVLHDLDTLLLGYFASTGDVGIYYFIYPIATTITIVLTSFAFLFMPMLSERHSDDDTSEMKRLYQIVTKWIFVITLPLFAVLFVFSDVIIEFIAPEYAPGAIALSILALGFMTHAVAGPNYKTLTAIGETRLVMYDNIGAAVLNVALNLLLIPRYSFVGAAVATVLSYVAVNATFSYQLYTRTGIHPFTSALVRPATASLLAVGVLFALTLTVDVTIPLFVALAALFVLVYAVIVLVLGGVEREEMMLLVSIEEQTGVDLGPVKRLAERFM
ncbi:flippase [Natronorarus salvus]|uniref:flippase n=1 Tax=Natronorarus salvus TaxID=3117733 RepID=UPI002F26B80C